MMKLIFVTALLLAATSAAAYCTTHTIYGSTWGSGILTCRTCCDSTGYCSTTCY